MYNNREHLLNESITCTVCCCDNGYINGDRDIVKTFKFTASDEQDACRKAIKCLLRIDKHKVRDYDTNITSFEDLNDEFNFSSDDTSPYIVYMTVGKKIVVFDESHVLSGFATKLSKCSSAQSIEKIIKAIAHFYYSMGVDDYDGFDDIEGEDIDDLISDEVTAIKDRFKSDTIGLLKGLLKLDETICMRMAS